MAKKGTLQLNNTSLKETHSTQKETLETHVNLKSHLNLQIPQILSN